MVSKVRSTAKRAARVTIQRLPSSVQDVVRVGVRRVRKTLRPDPPQPVVSLVVPVYGVESYLPACLDSLLAQTYTQLEIITVDDGSPDRSIDILRAYAARDPRIKIIRKANGGLGAARNTGAEAATGTYLMFIDSDDTIEPNAIKTFVRSLERTGSDFAVASYRRFSAAGTTPAAWWIRRAHRVARPATNLQEFPDIQVNAVAWSKCYRRTFWTENGFVFPVGVLYEDQAVSARAYVAARTFDVLSPVLCNWRIRDDRSSISQQTAEIHDLQARLEAAYESLAELSRPGFECAYEVRLAHYLSNDFPLTIKAAQHGDDKFWALLRDGLQRLTARATPAVWKRVSAQHRVATALVIGDLRQEATWYVGLGHNNPKNSPTVAHEGKVYTDLEVRHALGMEVTDPFLELGPHQLELIASIRRVYWRTADALVVEGWGYIDNLDLADVQPQIRAWCQRVGGSGKVRIELPVELEPVVEVSIASRHRYADYENSGFVLTIDPAALVAAGQRKRSDQVDWQVCLEVSAAGITRTGPLGKLDVGGSAGRLTGQFRDGLQLLPVFNRRDGLLISVRPSGDAVESTIFTDRSLQLSLAANPDRSPLALELANRPTRKTVRGSLVQRDDGRSETTVVIPDLRPEGEPVPSRTWTAQVVSMDGTKSPVAVIDDRAVDQRPTSSPYAGRTPQGNLAVYDEPRSIWIDTATLTPDGALELTGEVLGALVEELVFTVETAKASAAARPVARSVGAFDVSIPLRYDPWQLGETVLPVGSYTLVARRGGGGAALDGSAEIPVHASAGLIDTLPQVFTTEALRGQLKLERPDGLQILLEPPLNDLERGARRQQQLQLGLAERLTAPDFEFGAVLFRSYYGEIAGCNPLAVHRELRRRGTKHTLYWAVTDLSVQVPEGGIPVVHDSAEWYRLLHDAHFYMDNMHQPIYHVKPAHQIQVQTFHGYPFKQMGRSNWSRQNRDVAHIQSYLDRARDWDYLVSPASYGTEPLRREFGFPNEVLEIGYPRNDILLSPDAPGLAATVRARLGIRSDQKVLLYGPTFRDEMAQNDFKAMMVDFLDIPRLSAELGDDYVVLVRGHAFNARLDTRIGSRGNIIDVTDYPDIAELCLASDAAILDYSSLRFDYALTGQPMIFMVPDLEQYRASSRGTILDYEPTAPGPLVRTTAEVVAAASDLGQLRRDYADAYTTFRTTYLDLDDGHATERLVDQVFMVDGLEG